MKLGGGADTYRVNRRQEGLVGLQRGCVALTAISLLVGCGSSAAKPPATVDSDARICQQAAQRLAPGGTLTLSLTTTADLALPLFAMSDPRRATWAKLPAQHVVAECSYSPASTSPTASPSSYPSCPAGKYPTVDSTRLFLVDAEGDFTTAPPSPIPVPSCM